LPCAYLIQQNAMTIYGEVDIQTNNFLTSAVVCDEWSASSPGRVTPGGRAPGIYWIGGGGGLGLHHNWSGQDVEMNLNVYTLQHNIPNKYIYWFNTSNSFHSEVMTPHVFV
jgi:hypothetical protein